MPVVTPQSNALATAQALISLAGSAAILYHQIKSLQQIISLNSPVTVLNEQPTQPIINPGVLSGTNDGTPNPANPIVSLGVSYNDLVSANTYLGDLANLLDGTSAPTVGNRMGLFMKISQTNQ